MTGYAQAITATSWGDIVWEVRSLNQRFLECNFKMPELVRFLEPELRNILKNKISRGKIDCSLRVESNDNIAYEIFVNQKLIADLLGLSKDIATEYSNVKELSVSDLLSIPNVLQIKSAWSEQANQDIKKSFTELTFKLIDARVTEGQKLCSIINEKADQILENIKIVSAEAPKIHKASQVKLRERLEEVTVKYDRERLEQEIVYNLTKFDFAEELDRLKVHTEQVKELMNKSGVLGRKLDFLMQEMQREANTMSSKCISAATSNSVVDIKVLIEQIREQVQNIE